MQNFDLRPHVVVIGAQKAGTTWLQHALSCSNEVWYPKWQGEIQFFNRDYKDGLDHYLELYEDAPNHITTADVTPDYLDCSDTPRRIREAAPAINRPLRFVLICREPVSRLLSAYQMKVRYGFEGTLQEALAADKRLVDKGRYWTHLQRWLQYFDEEQFLIVLFDHLKNEKKTFCTQIERFLDLNESLLDAYGGGRVNSGGIRYSWGIERALQIGGRALRAAGMERLVYKLKQTSAAQMIFDWNQKPIAIENLDAIRADLRHRFKDEVQGLSQFINDPDLPARWGYR